MRHIYNHESHHSYIGPVIVLALAIGYLVLKLGYVPAAFAVPDSAAAITFAILTAGLALLYMIQVAKQ